MKVGHAKLLRRRALSLKESLNAALDQFICELAEQEDEGAEEAPKVRGHIELALDVPRPMNYGRLGRKTPFHDKTGKRLVVGDVVDIFFPEDGPFHEVKAGRTVVVESAKEGPFVMGIEGACDPETGEIMNGWTVKKVKRYCDVPDKAVIKSGATWYGWYSDAACTNLVSSNQSYTVSPTSDLTLYAKATRVAVNYTVSVTQPTGGTVSVSPSGSVEADTICTISSALDNGYTLSYYTVNGSQISGNTFTVAADSVVSAVLARTTPVVTVATPSRTTISDETGFDQSTCTFSSSLNVAEWNARATLGGVTPARGVGLLVESGATLSAGTSATVIVDDEELTNGDGTYTITVYVHATNGMWSDGTYEV